MVDVRDNINKHTFPANGVTESSVLELKQNESRNNFR